MPNQFLSPEGDLENYFVTEYQLIDQYIGDELFTWGVNGSGQLGTNDITTRLTPVNTSVGETNWKQVSVGYRYMAAVKTDGTLWTWGFNNVGQLGTNNTTTRSTPVTTFIGGTNWKQVSAGYYSCSAIKTDGTLWTWGLNDNGQLGTNNTTTRSTPVTTFAGGTNWKQVSTEIRTMAAIKTDGTLWTWGDNDAGQLGTNNTTNRSTPVTTFIGGTNWKQVDVGGHIYYSNNTFCAAIKTDGTLWTWGYNTFGALATNTTTTKSTPVTTFAGGTNWKQVSCGMLSVHAIKTDGTLYGWGESAYGALGTNNTTTRSTPVTTFAGGTNWKQVAGGMRSASCIKTDGTLWVWGCSILGDGTGSQRLVPVTTSAGGTNWKQVAGGAPETSSGNGTQALFAAVTSGTNPTFFVS